MVAEVIILSYCFRAFSSKCGKYLYKPACLTYNVPFLKRRRFTLMSGYYGDYGGRGHGAGFAFILVLFILLVIIGAAAIGTGFGGY
jgi:uncharacterized protein (TIGR01732 family)